jgi:hypothetical protein
LQHSPVHGQLNIVTRKPALHDNMLFDNDDDDTGLVTCRCLAPAYHAGLVEVCLCMTLSCKDFLLKKGRKNTDKNDDDGDDDVMMMMMMMMMCKNKVKKGKCRHFKGYGRDIGHRVNTGTAPGDAILSRLNVRPHWFRISRSPFLTLAA